MAQAKTVSRRRKTVFLVVLLLLFLLLTIPYLPLRSDISRTYSGGIWEDEGGIMTAEVTASLEAVRTRYLLRSQASGITGTVTLTGAELDGDHTLYLREASAEAAAGWVFQSPALDQGAHSTLDLRSYTQNSFDFREDFSAVVVRLRREDADSYLILSDGGEPAEIFAEYTAAREALPAP